MLRIRCKCRLLASCKCITVAVCLTLVCILMMVKLYVSYSSCSVDNASKEIQELCSLYYQNEVAGNMCHKLCDEKILSLRSCGNNRIAWKNVFLMDCKGCEFGKTTSKMVIKAQYDMSIWDREINEKMVINKSETIEKSVESIRFRIASQVKIYFGIDYHTMENCMSFIWNQNFDDYVKRSRTKDAAHVAAKSIAALGMQREYITMRIFGEKTYIPKLYGTCGPAYFVEYTPSFLKLGLVIFQGKLPEVLSLTFADWQKRAVIALKTITLLNTLQTSFDVPVELCDIESHNFGVNDQHEIALLDSDSICFNKSVPGVDKNCDKDNQCGWLSCHGYCNQKTKKCGGIRINNNLQVVCHRIFLSRVEKFGLLRNAPGSIKTELHKTLKQCAYAKEVVDGVHWRKPQSVIKNKIEFLVSSTLNK